MKNIILVDNATYSFLFNLNNGIPILPFYKDKNDKELLKLRDYLMSLKHVDDVRKSIQKHFKWNLFKKYYDSPNLLVNKLFS